MILDGAYPTDWDGDTLHGASRNVLFDVIYSLGVLINDAISNVAYPTGWDTDEGHGASRNALYDALVGLTLSGLSEKAHVSLSGVSTSQHHIKTVASELNLADLNEKSYNNLTDKPTIDLGIGKESATIVHSNDTEKSTNETDYTKIKEIIVYENLKTFRVSFEIKSAVGGQMVSCKVLVNGDIIGGEHGTNEATYQDYYSEGVNLEYGDLVQIEACRFGTADCFVQNMKICYDKYVNNDP